MKWFKEDKPYVDKTIKVGSKKIKKHFCLFPKKFRNNGGNHYIWLETVYIVYERIKGGWVPVPWGDEVYEPDYWQEIGVAYSYDDALDEVWLGS